MRRHTRHNVTHVTAPLPTPPKGTTSPEPHLRLADVLAELGLSRAAFYRMRTRGTAPACIKLPNGQLRFRRRDLDAWLRLHEEDLTC